jgi:hypothetical protein
MTEAPDFTAALARAAKSDRNIYLLVDCAYEYKTLSIVQINWMINAAKDEKTSKLRKYQK